MRRRSRRRTEHGKGPNVGFAFHAADISDLDGVLEFVKAYYAALRAGRRFGPCSVRMGDSLRLYHADAHDFSVCALEPPVLRASGICRDASRDPTS